MAALASFVEDGDFEISDMVEGNHWTNDWAVNKEGEVYSNKAPGPMLVALPVYFLIDAVQSFSLESAAERSAARFHARHLNGHLLSLLFQVLLTIAVAMWALKTLSRLGVSQSQQEWFVLALYFGNLASVFMNTYFAHAFAGTLLLGLLLSYLNQSWRWAGVFLGLALLTDYSSGIAFVLFGIVLLRELYLRRSLAPLWGVAIGGLLPFLLWSWYHVQCFGGVLSIALAHQNPEHKDLVEESAQAWGVISFLPKPQILGFLLWHPGRGIFVTTPWIAFFFLALVYAFRSVISDSKKITTVFLVLGTFVALWWMNAAFGQWRSGAAPGSRYLCMIFPAMAFVSAYFSKAYPQWIKTALWWSLGVSILYFVGVYSTTLLMGDDPLWFQIYGNIFQAESQTPLLRFGLMLLFFAVAIFLRRRRRVAA